MQSDKDKRREKDIVSLILMLLPLEIYLVPPSRARLEDQTHWETPTVSSAQCHTQTQVGPVSVMKSSEKLEKKNLLLFLVICFYLRSRSPVAHSQWLHYMQITLTYVLKRPQSNTGWPHWPHLGLERCSSSDLLTSRVENSTLQWWLTPPFSDLTVRKLGYACAHHLARHFSLPLIPLFHTSPCSFTV